MPAVSSRDILLFGGDQSVHIHTEPLSPPSAGQVQVATRVSAISAGTERLVYTGHLPHELAADASIDQLQPGGEDDNPYPMPYGYACAGTVIATGADVSATWLGRRVFAFHPHATHFNAAPQDLIEIADSLTLEAAVLYPNMETATGLVMDGAPIVGERVAVFGLGVVGLLTFRLLLTHPLERVIGIDPDPTRRDTARALVNRSEAAQAVVAAPDDVERVETAAAVSDRDDPTKDLRGGVDLAYEVSGHPDTLNAALALCGYGGRIVIGSWYGTKTAPVELGRRFHRSHATIRSSQVSTIGPEHRPRWTKARRTSVVLNLLGDLQPDALGVETRPFRAARQTYRALADGSDEAVQILHSYSHSTSS
ncbi:zinc-dependent alcohol dehydrogenase [Longibacter sp.]|uniref:zinc-dependent alcohol dehydrogenase n=1 Tax=Longibacter sp. TaxID=2045415 RepID=UPI003EB89137